MIVQNKSGNSKLPPDLEAEVWFYFGMSLQNKQQIKELNISEVLKADYRPPEKYSLKQITEAEAAGNPLTQPGPVDDDVAAIDLKWTSSGATTVKFKFWDIDDIFAPSTYRDIRG